MHTARLDVACFSPTLTIWLLKQEDMNALLEILVLPTAFVGCCCFLSGMFFRNNWSLDLAGPSFLKCATMFSSSVLTSHTITWIHVLNKFSVIFEYLLLQAKNFYFTQPRHPIHTELHRQKLKEEALVAISRERIRIGQGNLSNHGQWSSGRSSYREKALYLKIYFKSSQFEIAKRYLNESMIYSLTNPI